MKIEALKIANFRGIKLAQFGNLGETVIIAGPNGSGKSCVFDAVRLLKSLYGGYQQNELQQWLGEFQVDASRIGQDLVRLFNDKNLNLEVTCEFVFSDEEKNYISQNANELLSETIWRTLIPEAFQYGFYRLAQFSAQFRERQPEVDARLAQELPQLQSELAKPSVTGQLVAHPNGSLVLQNSKLLNVVFNTYRPPMLGLIDFHGAQRMYNRESVQAITLSFDQNQRQQRQQSSLYNYNAKYSGVKGEMAAAYVKDILAEKAAVEQFEESLTLTETLKQLFETFFPDKIFLGPQPTQDGNLTFPVQVGEGSIHDLDELSAGEKEVLYGYLRMRNSAPKHSIILLDEPELHLNPRLIKGLPQFYRQHLSIALNNQLWLVSHSDALLREVVGRSGYNVFHMLPCTSPNAAKGQVRSLQANEQLEVAVIDLVGDVAAYRPGGKAVIFEGGGDSDFDQRLVGTLFPELQETANLISGTNKVRVEALLDTLSTAHDKGHIPIQFFAIVDPDFEDFHSKSEFINLLCWDVYHIENYLLDPKYIIGVLRSLGELSVPTEEQVLNDLRAAAREVLPSVLRTLLSEYANKSLVRSIDLGTDPAAENTSLVLRESISRSIKRIEKANESELSQSSLESKLEELSTGLEKSFADGTWRKKLPGRSILKRYTAKSSVGVTYEVFRNLIVSKMVDDGYKPEGMAAVVNQILEA